uniref:Peptidyl-prolyl cis-trans isomerase n=1 Tax=Ixodes ricinus TaxID=34613 RepID=A0A090X9X7_IXORI
MSVVIETTLGDMTVDLYIAERPRTCLNFLKLCKLKYYNLCLFHRVEQNFIAQTGDPTGSGRGGESLFAKLYGEQARYFEAERKPRLKHLKLGTLSMVSSEDGLHGSQFILTLGENVDSLDGRHSVFGCVSEGAETLTRINSALCDGDARPYQDIRITHTVVLHDPFDDPPGLEVPGASPEPTLEMLRSDRIGAHEALDDTQGRTIEEIEEEIRNKEAKARATVLEMIGDLPDVDAAPPENVLFVCKLNPVTTDEDLEIIFSRFGPIKSCEVTPGPQDRRLTAVRLRGVHLPRALRERLLQDGQRAHRRPSDPRRLQPVRSQAEVEGQGAVAWSMLTKEQRPAKGRPLSGQGKLVGVVTASFRWCGSDDEKRQQRRIVGTKRSDHRDRRSKTGFEQPWSGPQR